MCHQLQQHEIVFKVLTAPIKNLTLALTNPSPRYPSIVFLTHTAIGLEDKKTNNWKGITTSRNAGTPQNGGAENRLTRVGLSSVNCMTVVSLTFASYCSTSLLAH